MSLSGGKDKIVHIKSSEILRKLSQLIGATLKWKQWLGKGKSMHWLNKNCMTMGNKTQYGSDSVPEDISRTWCWEPKRFHGRPCLSRVGLPSLTLYHGFSVRNYHLLSGVGSVNSRVLDTFRGIAVASAEITLIQRSEIKLNLFSLSTVEQYDILLKCTSCLTNFGITFHRYSSLALISSYFSSSDWKWVEPSKIIFNFPNNGSLTNKFFQHLYF